MTLTKYLKVYNFSSDSKAQQYKELMQRKLKDRIIHFSIQFLVSCSLQNGKSFRNVIF